MKLKEPMNPKDAVQKRFLFLKVTKAGYNLPGLSSKITQMKSDFKAIQDQFKENRKAHKEHQITIQNELETMTQS